MALTFVNGGDYEVTAIGTLDDAIEVRNVYQLRLVSGGPLTESVGLSDIDDWLTALINVIKVVQTVLQVWRGFSVSHLDGVNNTGFIPFDTPLVGGNTTADMLPPGVAGLVFMRTGEKNRQLRKYFPSMTEGNVDAAGNFTAGWGTQIAGVTPLLLNTFAGSGSWVFGHAHPSLPATHVRPTSLTVSLNPSYQRRRRRGTGI